MDDAEEKSARGRGYWTNPKKITPPRLKQGSDEQ
jgi:acetoacetate decarboxylase